MKYISTLLCILYMICAQNGLSQSSITIGENAEFYSVQNSIVELEEGSMINEGIAELKGSLLLTSSTDKVLNNESVTPVIINEVRFSGADFQVSGPFLINSSFILSDMADVLLNSNTAIDLDENAELTGENENQVITGQAGSYITTSRNVETNNSFGGIGFTLNDSDVNLGQTQIYRRYGTIEIDNEPTLFRYYEISPTTNSGLNADVTFSYAPVDLNGLSETSLSLFRSVNGVDSWEERGGIVDEINNTVQLDEIDAFSFWAIANSTLLLPVELVYFNAEAVNNNFIVCRWQTASELNNSHFEIERSQNGQQFEFVMQVEGNGTTNATNQYEINDEQPYNGTSFYRLKQVDHSGDFEYSEIQQVYIDQSSGIVLFPNPTVEELQVIIPQTLQADAYQIININGQVVQTGEYREGNLSIQVNELANGIYFFDLQSKGKSVKQIKFIKQ